MTGNAKDLIKYLLEADSEALFDIEPHKAKRNLDQNAMYWATVGEIARKIGNTTAFVHNTILAAHPIIEKMNGQPVCMILPDEDDTYKKVMNSTAYHLLQTSQVRIGKDGVSIFRYWYVLKGSHEMNKQEFSAILSEAVNWAEEMGVRLPYVER